MKNPFEGLLELNDVKLITRHVRRIGFRGQDADEVIQLTAIRLSRTEVRDEAMLLAAANESAADVRRRESRHRRRVDRLQELAIAQHVESPDNDTAVALDLREIIAGLPARERAVCDGLSGGLTVREVARKLGISATAVQCSKERIRQHFEDTGLAGDAA